MSADKGLALIVVIIVIVIAAIVILGIASFISSGLSLAIAKASMEGAIFAAQAGIYAAIHDYVSDPSQPYWDKTAAPQNISTNIYYNTGKDANFLLISALSSERSSRVLRRIPLANLNNTQSITVNKMEVEWYNFSANLSQIDLGGATRWSGSVTSGTTITLASPFALNAKQSFFKLNDNALQFSRNIPNNAVIIATFIFDPPAGDGSSRKAILWTNGPGRNNEFSITATGEVRGRTTWKRTAEATYDAGSGKITSWQEAEGHI